MNKQSHTIEPEELMAYLDGELSPERGLELASHLEHCRECQKLSAELREISQNLVAWEVEESEATRIPVDASGALIDRKAERKEVELWRRLLNVRLWPKKAWALAATATAVILIFMLTPTYRYKLPASRPQQELSYYYDRGHGGAGGNADKLVANQAPPPPQPPPQVATRNGALSGYARTPGKVVAEDEISVADETSSAVNGPMIVRTVDLNLTVKEFAHARSSLDEILKQHHGHIGELNVNTPTGSARSFTAALRIPSPQLESALADLKRLGRVEKEAQNGEEVTQQYVDLEARLKNARNTESRLIQLQRERTGKLSDVLSVEKEIGRVRGEIEQMEAERKSLRNRIDFATLNLTLIEDYKAELKVVPPSIGTQIRNAAVEGYRSVVDGLFSLLLWLLSWVPTLLIWALVLFYPARMAWRKLRSKEA